MSNKTTNNCSDVWIKPSFDLPLIQTSNEKQLINKKSNKRQLNEELAENESKIYSKFQNNSICFMSSMNANNRQELVFSSYKLNQLNDWFRKQFVDKSTTESKFLLLKGPTGAGKTTSLRVLAKEFKVQVIEYNSFSQHLETVLDPNLNEKRENNLILMNQIESFKGFIADCVKYKNRLEFESNDGAIGCSSESTQTQTTDRLLLIEEFPNIFHLKPEALHKELRLLNKRFGNRLIPIVFIISDTMNGLSEEYKLLPKSLQFELRFKTIAFKSISPTALQKTLNRLSDNQLSKNEIQNLIESSSGDIRNAVNNLQLVYMHSIDNKCDKRGKKLRTKQLDTNSDYLSRDSSLTLSHAIGKVLYAKRVDSQIESYRLPEHLSAYECNSLKDSPESIADKIQVSSDVFNAWLHQNYLDFTDSIEIAQNCMDWLCESDIMCSGEHHFANKPVFDSYQSILAMYGLMFNLSKKSSNDSNESKVNHKFKAFERPQSFVANRFADSLKTQINQSLSLKSRFSSVDSLVIDLMPFISQMPKHLHSFDTHFKYILNKVVVYEQNNDNINEQLLSSALSQYSFDENNLQTNTCEVKSNENVLQINNNFEIKEEDYRIEDMDSD